MHAASKIRENGSGRGRSLRGVDTRSEVGIAADSAMDRVVPLGFDGAGHVVSPRAYQGATRQRAQRQRSIFRCFAVAVPTAGRTNVQALLQEDSS